MKESVNGIILIISCMKHVNTRLKEFSLPKNEYCGWKVIYVVGNLFMDDDFVIKDNFMIVKCEDSYIHLVKKLALSIKYVYSLFDIKQGILRCADDIKFSENNLMKFLSTDYKPDYYGQNLSGNSYLRINREHIKKTRIDNWMDKYYSSHPNDLVNPQHNLIGVNIANYKIRPNIDYAAEGVIYYLSNHACSTLIGHMENINYNIFHFDEFSQSYPYTIEDCAVAFIMYFNNIPFVQKPIFFMDERLLYLLKKAYGVIIDDYDMKEDYGVSQDIDYKYTIGVLEDTYKETRIGFATNKYK
jgi:hypothetical protein